ncbi:MAG: secondary thiamine-phosphate synthase enzyme YjbQ [Wenzhouxiangella sp.]
MHQIVTVNTPGRALVNITREVSEALEQSGVKDGVCQLFIRHTSASLMINENADPDVLHDLETFFSGLVIDGDARFRHRAEGPDDMAAHIRSALTQITLSIPVAAGRLMLGTWQGIYLWEHRHARHQREVVATFISFGGR